MDHPFAMGVIQIGLDLLPVLSLSPNSISPRTA